MEKIYDSTSWYLKDETDFGKISKNIDQAIKDVAEDIETNKKELEERRLKIINTSYPTKLLEEKCKYIHKRIKMKKHRSKKWRNGKKK